MSGLFTFTFDDGISANTELLLDILDQEKIKATFFIISSTLGLLNSKNRKILKAIHDKGHIVGNHTVNHKDLTKLTAEQIKDELEDCRHDIGDTVKHQMKYFRPPYGAVNKEVRNIASGMGFKTVMWDIDPRDWDRKNSKEEMLESYHSTIGDPNKKSYILLQHDMRKESVEIVPDIAKIVRDKGFKIVSLDEYYS